jgi:hypothetical protein
VVPRGVACADDLVEDPQPVASPATAAPSATSSSPETELSSALAAERSSITYVAGESTASSSRTPSSDDGATAVYEPSSAKSCRHQRASKRSTMKSKTT